ncbi:hypothetical protein VFPPC_01969 [Pochonia chlamydosporia 170]|uniref:Uncharacterized protein n=1 Tax=Pochonia chlamydosporia 170 TaxID=1380566 RepID=A0A179F6E9_METCM|nr:hypothetical protein VFPPC_01969 [Pochonia chlamydosporia 170]OAQ60930.1 hypothetical protein VFPPC_01969 [Pochonia chlamydosporia 170]
MAALERQNKVLESNKDELLEILDLLKSDSDERSMALLLKLKASTETDISALWDLLKRDVTTEDGSILDHLCVTSTSDVPSQSSSEFNLILRHPVAYPALAPVDLPSKLLRPSPIRLAKAYRGENELFGSIPQGPQPVPIPSSQTPADPSTVIPGKSPLSYCDDRLASLKIIQWTSVPVTDEFAAGAISLFLKTDHPILGLFDAELFINDLVEPCLRFCSPLLVNSLLYWACQAYAAFDPRAIAYSDAFFIEADNLWSLEWRSDSLNAVAASQFLSLGSVYYGKDGGVPYLNQGIQMAQRMKLFGVPDTATSQTVHAQPQEWTRAMSHTAWGAYNWTTMRCIQFQEQDQSIRYPPRLAIPGLRSSGLESDSTTEQIPSQPAPYFTGPTFPALCELWSIASQWILEYYKDGGSEIVSRISQEYAESMYQKLLSWSDKLPNEIARGDESTDHSATMHIWLHILILSIFRPFATSAQRVAPKINTTQFWPMGPFMASVKQLKHLVRIFDCRYPSSSRSILWHVALLQVANVMVNMVGDPDSLAYFLLCISCYRDLYPSYRVVYSIVKGLLSMARQRGVISGSTAASLFEQMQNTGKHHMALDSIRAAFVVDLDLALTNTSSSQVDALADDFDTMAMFDALTVSTDYIAISSADTPSHSPLDLADGS